MNKIINEIKENILRAKLTDPTKEILISAIDHYCSSWNEIDLKDLKAKIDARIEKFEKGLN